MLVVLQQSETLPLVTSLKYRESLCLAKAVVIFFQGNWRRWWCQLTQSARPFPARWLNARTSQLSMASMANRPARNLYLLSEISGRDRWVVIWLATILSWSFPISFRRQIGLNNDGVSIVFMSGFEIRIKFAVYHSFQNIPVCRHALRNLLNFSLSLVTTITNTWACTPSGPRAVSVFHSCNCPSPFLVRYWLGGRAWWSVSYRMFVARRAREDIA